MSRAGDDKPRALVTGGAGFLGSHLCERLLVEGYRVAGKTGTAEIAGPDGYSTSLTNASFVGWGPVDDPRFIVFVWLEKPTSSPWGSVVAAPVFSEVVSKLVVLLDLPPDEVRLNLANQ